MKKFVLILVLCFSFAFSVDAKEMKVKFSKCVDGDTAKFIYKDEEISARFLAIDTPETKHPTKGEEPFGKEASEYTCTRLKEANTIVLETDSGSDEKDKYDRLLVWVFVDDELLQKELVERGYASVAYLYGDYKYTSILEETQQQAEDEKVGIWSITEESTDNTKKDFNYKEIILLIGIILMLCLFSTKARKKVKKEVETEAKKALKNRIKNIMK